ncbi:hypothetical protein JL49_11210 [Pseudoalteromonas luteoviolacea]|uniref:Uncharacterized protein n=2 Tax=Pseudoalteromonas luteoviolacea TaxID=43657 RepID=A0A167APV3_9GAMM|nr:hypothetical protein N482_13990 [Pseudoalteromonas luteoviolacea NCIMB 1942]KZX00459.1 hypothetical protein JL49_11210 [Pseudoalteromonas luteoviolacea]
MVMFIVQPTAKAAMVCSHTMPSGHVSMNMETESHGHKHMATSNNHMPMSMHGDMDCCKTECSCPTSMCAPFSLYVGGANLLYSRSGLADKPLPSPTGTPQSTVNFVYKPPILA